MSAIVALVLGIAVGSISFGQLTGTPGGERPKLVPEPTYLSDSIRRTIEAPFLTDDERRDARLFHGVWTGADLDTPERQARAALYDDRLNDDILKSPSAPDEDRAEAMIRRGEMRDAIDILDEADSVRAVRLRAEALEWLGRFAEADEAINPAIKLWQRNQLQSAEDLVEIARCLIIRARLRGEPAAYYHQIINTLSNVHQRVDRFYWPAKLVEAELLLEKDNFQEAVQTLHEVVSMNARASRAWYLLGEVALHSYDFDSVEEAATRLEHINPEHPLAIRLRAETALQQRSPDVAEEYVEELLSKYPRNREALALRAAVYAARFDETGMHSAFEAFDQLSPGHPYACYVAGMQLSSDRQYELAAEILNEAIRRQPNWAAPQVELGLMEMQAGRDSRALVALRRVSQLDPFNVRAAFSLHLLESLLNYEIHDSEYFAIRFDPQTSDRVLAFEMGRLLDNMHQEVTTAFRHDPHQKTMIELMPSHERFAVRITGMPDIHTIAASTGPVIAMESPREGPNHFGTYDWLRVIRHEYVHTVTLSQTNNRIPHWLTEAAAVWQELAPRDYDTCLALTRAYKHDELFNLDEINWAFVRPKRPGDRSLAYAQGHWMFEFFIDRFGHARMVRLLDAYRDGLPEERAIPEATGLTRDEFYHAFLDWAGPEIKRWGLAPSPSLSSMLDRLARTNADYQPLIEPQATAIAKRINTYVRQLMTIPIDVIVADSTRSNDDDAPDSDADEQAQAAASAWRAANGHDIPMPTAPFLRIPPATIQLSDIDRLLREHPTHPDLLRLRIEAMQRGLPNDPADAVNAQALVEYVNRYMEARPVDPYSFRVLADLYLNSENPLAAIPLLEELDRREQSTGAYAIELARQYRTLGNYRLAIDRARRALVIEPFNANYRELAAAIAIQAKNFEEARHQLEALTMIEPDRAQHRKRLDALDRLIEKQQGG